MPRRSRRSVIFFVDFICAELIASPQTQAFAQTLSADTIPQTGAEEEIGQMYRGTYSPDDNKLRLYASLRLDEETYKKVHDAGFRWAPKQGLFVAPAWTPGREDVLLSLAGDIGDEDSTLFDRQEQRAERFNDYPWRDAHCGSGREAESERDPFPARWRHAP